MADLEYIVGGGVGTILLTRNSREARSAFRERRQPSFEDR
jgi:hypothetical protein